jgi:hypothetical protein
MTSDEFGLMQLNFSNHTKIKNITIDLKNVMYYLLKSTKAGDLLLPYSKLGCVMENKPGIEFCKNKVFADIL